MQKIKDIRLKSVIGKWYEYKSEKKYQSDFYLGELEKTDIDTLLELHYKWGNKLAEVLKEQLSLAIELQETVLIQQKYSEFLAEHNTNSTSCILSGDGFELCIILDSTITAMLINRVTGGQGQNKKIDKLTDIEKVILSTILSFVTETYGQVLLSNIDSVVLEINTPKLKIDERIRRDSEVFSFANTLLFGEGVSAAIEVMYAHQSVEKLIEKYTEANKKRPKKITVNLSPESVVNVKVPVKVKIGTTSVMMDDVINLEKGDVFQLNEKLNDSVYFVIDEDTEFYAYLGKIAGNYAVKILEKKAKFYDITVSEQKAVASEAVVTQIAEKQEAVIVPAGRPEKVAAEVQTAPVEKVDEESIVIKDPLLEELESSGVKAEESEEFTWDIDDLK